MKQIVKYDRFDNLVTHFQSFKEEYLWSFEFFNINFILFNQMSKSPFNQQFSHQIPSIMYSMNRLNPIYTCVLSS